MGGQIKVSLGKQGPRSKGKWGMDRKQTYLPVLVIWQILPLFQPSQEDPTCLTSRRQDGIEWVRAKAAFISLPSFIKEKNLQTTANVTHKLQCSRGRKSEQKLRHKGSGSVQEGHNYLTEGPELPAHDGWVTAQQKEPASEQ